MTIVFGTLATLLAVVGLYGLMSYTVARRTREIGIRMALGARSADIGWLVIREVMLLGAVGGVVGLAAAWWLTRFFANQLYGVEPTDPASIAAAVGLLASVAIVAAWQPSTRAARIDPMTALRYE